HQHKTATATRLFLGRGLRLRIVRKSYRHGRGRLRRAFHFELGNVFVDFRYGVHVAALSAVLTDGQGDVSPSERFSIMFNNPLTRMRRSSGDKPASARS